MVVMVKHVILRMTKIADVTMKEMAIIVVTVVRNVKAKTAVRNAIRMRRRMMIYVNIVTTVGVNV
jgi:hypothetical protein